MITKHFSDVILSSLIRKKNNWTQDHDKSINIYYIVKTYITIYLCLPIKMTNKPMNKATSTLWAKANPEV